LPTAYKTKVVMGKWAKLNFAVLVIGDNFTAKGHRPVEY